ncbi:MAG TPA: cyclase family protein [Steroidobacter sp.]|nr:cyclase family protein [Steroidobacter sp.]
MSNEAPTVIFERAGRRWRAATHGYDASIPLAFDGMQPSFFGAEHASARPLAAGAFIGDVRRGGSCNCASYSLTPHCNGTHTECVGHIVEERVSVRDAACAHLSAALLISTAPVDAAATCEASDPRPHAGDRLITQTLLEAAARGQGLSDYDALIVRTLPNNPTKRFRNYSAGHEAPPYFSAEAMRWIVEQGVRDLVVDLPSVDRANDEGRLTCHRIFWGLPAGAKSAAAATRAYATITELAYIDNAIADGPYLLNLQIAPFAADAAPSRPILLPLSPA